MAERVCPWWLGYLLASPVRRCLIRQDPQEILSPYVHPEMTVLEPGPGMGFFTLPLARLVGEHGRVVAIDLQQKMLNGLQRRAAKAGLASRIQCRLAARESLATGDLAGQVDFVLAFAVVHEIPEGNHFFTEAAQAMKSGAVMLLVEPAGHVTAAAFDAELAAARATGLEIKSQPAIRRSHTALLQKK
jgi:predicted O-methyltransferase YrrM